MVQHLVSKHPQDVNAIGGKCGTPLHAPVARGHVEVSQLLLANCIDVNIRRIDGQAPLHLTSGRGQLDIVQLLLDRDVSLNGCRKNPSTSVDPAVPCRLVNYTRMILVRNTGVSACNNRGQMPLYLTS
jgi:ankyrin repeat protein